MYNVYSCGEYKQWTVTLLGAKCAYVSQSSIRIQVHFLQQIPFVVLPYPDVYGRNLEVGLLLRQQELK